MNPSSRSLLAPAVDLQDAIAVLVDDEGESARALSERLTETGFQVHIATSGPQAKQLAFRQSPDVILLDLKRADMDSFELCRQLKMTPQMRSVPVLFLNERSDVAAKVRAFRLGAVDYLHRPYEFEELLVRIEHHIRSGRKLRDLEREKLELSRENKELKKEKATVQPVYSNPAELPNGFMLDGKYRLDGRIGLGGFGVVYRATHLQLQRQVAVKVFRSLGHLSSEEALKRFRQEGTSASRLNHPNAVAMLDSGIAPGGIPYLAMELLVGRTLADELRERSQLQLTRCIQIVLPICDVLVEAHAIGLIHRDIKPENVFLHRARYGEVIKVLDFGIAKLLGTDSDLDRPAMTGGGGIVGTPVYMAPERLRHGPYDGRSDVYSVGVMLYQMLCGRTPFPSDAKSFLEVVLNHLNDPAPPLRKWNPGIPEPVERLVMRTLEKDPAQRPSARELLTELVQVVRATVGAIDSSEPPANQQSGEAIYLLRGDLAPNSAPPDGNAGLGHSPSTKSRSSRPPRPGVQPVPSSRSSVPSSRSSHPSSSSSVPSASQEVRPVSPSGGSQPPSATADTLEGIIPAAGIPTRVPSSTAVTMEMKLPSIPTIDDPSGSGSNRS
jgi:serine/threonine protein kinase/CheY-like chemotaxis protein